MQIHPSAEIINRETGEPLVDDGKSVTLGFLVVRALDAKYRDDDGVAPSVLFERYRLASRLRKAGPGSAIDLGIDEAKLIKDTVPKMYPPGIFGQIWDHLDEAASPAKPAADAHAAMRPGA